jgi:acyl-CoA synthetase (AMP-forming)/AMP-acid ligase II
MTTFPFVTSIAHINWSESLNQLAQKFGHRTLAFDGALEKITFEKLNVFAHQVARVLIEKGVKSAEPVASLLTNHLDAIWIT